MIDLIRLMGIVAWQLGLTYCQGPSQGEATRFRNPSHKSLAYLAGSIFVSLATFTGISSKVRILKVQAHHNHILEDQLH